MYEELLKQISVCKQKLLDLSVYTEEFIVLHDAFFWNNEKDATLLKEKIKEKIVGVLNED